MNTPAKIQTQSENMNMSEMQTADIMMNAPLLAQIDHMATRMANAKATIPDHLKGNEGDCWAIIMQSIQWGMNPYVVAQKTHIVGGKLGYEAQLVNAVVQNSGMIEGVFQYEYRGEGEQLQCRVGAVIKGEKVVTWNEWLTLADVKIRNSPLWKTNIPQQIGYLQLKNWVRKYTPGPLLGVYTPDEIPTAAQVEREIGPAASDLNDVLRGGNPSKAKKEADIVDAEIVDEKPEAEADPYPEPDTAAESKPLTYAMVADAINGASDTKTLSEIGNNLVPDFLHLEENGQFREELMALYKHRQKELKAIADEQKQ